MRLANRQQGERGGNEPPHSLVARYHLLKAAKRNLAEHQSPRQHHLLYTHNDSSSAPQYVLVDDICVKAFDRPMAMPSIVEPTPSSPSLTPPASSNGSPDPNSSSSSLYSSRPRSRSSSATSRSESSSPNIELSNVLKNATVDVSLDQPPPPLPNIDTAPKSPRGLPESQRYQIHPPTSAPRVPPNQTQSSGQSILTAGPSPRRLWLAKESWYQWSQAVLGAIGVVLALISLLIYGVRSYKMAVWTTQNDKLQACTGLVQVSERQFLLCRI